MTVLQVCAYAADYPGNFIASLEALERKLKEKNIDTIYAFVERARDKSWCREIQDRTKVYFLPEAKARILPKTYRVFRRIYQENQIDIVHSHFELYDIPATVTAPKKTKVFWHLHDPINPGSGLRSILWKLQYGVVSKRATLLSVADYYCKMVIGMGFPASQTAVILNSIDLGRIKEENRATDKTYDFLTFGWDFFRKGDDLIIKAGTRLAREGYRFQLLLNGNEKTWPVLEEYLAGEHPAWLVKGEPVTDVNKLFADAKVFIQASRRETFSYAVCEAAYAGLPVLSSDIAGLEWAHALPSVAFFENENEVQLYQLMRDALEGKTCPDSSIAASRQIISEEYSLDSWAKKVIEQYQID